MTSEINKDALFKNNNIEIIYDKEYCIFKIKNFLDHNSYNFINNNFPIFDAKIIRSDNFLKYSFDESSDYYKELCKSNKNFMNIHDFFFSREFSTFFFKRFYKKLLLYRFYDFKNLIRLFKYPSFNNFKNKFFFNNIITKVQYSYLKNNAVINPHTDSKAKIISLMLYFPSLEDNSDIKFGTSFFKSNLKNHSNIHYNQNDLLKVFQKNSELIYKTPFEKYNLYGFIRSKKSWHSVDKISCNENYLRKSININFYYN